MKEIHNFRKAVFRGQCFKQILTRKILSRFTIDPADEKLPIGSEKTDRIRGKDGRWNIEDGRPSRMFVNQNF